MASCVQAPAVKKRPDFAEVAMGIACGIAVPSLALFLGVMPWLPRIVGARDFVVYWSTGQQIVHHGNPFDPVIMERIEHAAGFPGHGAFYMRNPPWGLPLTLPLGFFGSQGAALPWSLLMLAILILCVRTLWKMYGQPKSGLEWLAYCFPPALVCVAMGQTSLFLLLGLVLFLRWHRERPFWAGAGLWFCTLKPHLFLPFAVVLLAWIIVNRSYRILLGTASALAVSCALTEAIDPAAWNQYLHWANTSGISHEFIPCVGVVLRTLANPDASWLPFVPLVPGCIWALAYFWRRRESWSWIEQGSLVMLVSIIVAPYHWVYDESLAIPALLYAACQTRSRMLLGVLACLYIAFDVQVLATVGLDSLLYLWPCLAWLMWYLFAKATATAADAAIGESDSPVAAVTVESVA